MLEEVIKPHKQILLVEDDSSCAKAIISLLTSKGYDVEAADGGRSAASMVGLRDYDLVLSDIQLPELNGIQLLHYIRQMKASLPVVLMTGYASYANHDEALGLGAAGFLTKPFSSRNLLSIVENAFKRGPVSHDVAEAVGSNYCSIPIDDFVSGKRLDFDVYVRVLDGKFVRIANAGEELQSERLDSYREKQARFLHVLRDDFIKYVELQMKLTDAISHKTSIAEARKNAFLRHANEVLLQHIFIAGVDERSFKYAQDMTAANLSVFARNAGAFSLLELLNSGNDHVFTHSMGVAVYSAMLARAIGWESRATIEKVCLGGLLHDVGLKELPRTLLDKPMRSYSADEHRLYERHPILGVDLLKGVPDISTEVLLIVAQHHENRCGSGYPGSLRDSTLFGLAKVVAIANEFCELTLKSPGNRVYKAEEAIKTLLTVKKPFLDSKMLEAFASLFRGGSRG